MSRGEWFAVMNGIAAITENDAGVIHFARISGELNIPDQAGSRIMRECGDHRLEPAGLKDQVVVEQGEEFALSDARSAVVGGGVAEIALVQQDNMRGRQFAEKIAGAVRGSVIDQNDFVRETGWKSGSERS